MTHACVSKLTIIVSDNGLLPGRRQVKSNYLNQCLNIVNGALGNKLQTNHSRNLHIFVQDNVFENVVRKLAAILSRPQYVKPELAQCSLHE